MKVQLVRTIGDTIIADIVAREIEPGLAIDDLGRSYCHLRGTTKWLAPAGRWNLEDFIVFVEKS